MVFGKSVQKVLSYSTVFTSTLKTRASPHTISSRWATIPAIPHNQPTTSFPWSLHSKVPTTTDIITEHLSTLKPFSAPPAPTLQKPIQSPLFEETMELTSTLRKRRLKMNKHKHKKLRKRTRALRKRLGK
ncbi:unnamed protein product [Cunninghamella blakesleeana]